MKRLKYLILLACLTVAAACLGGCGLSDKINEWGCESHDFGAMPTQVLKEATCKKGGVEEWTCRLCGYEEERDTAKLPHTYDNGVELKAATCTEAGEKKYTCVVCDATKTETLVKLPHTEVSVTGVNATCTEDGYTSYKYCSECNAFTQEKRVIYALGHVKVVDLAVEPTCTSVGSTKGSHCGVCDEVLEAQEEIQMLSHSVVLLPEEAPTCSTAGITAGQECEHCGEVYRGREYIAPTGEHKYEVTVEAKDPTCVLLGNTAATKCSVCNAVGDEYELIPALGHEVGADCVCTRCGEIVHGEITEGEAVAPTCTEVGYTAPKSCSVCGVEVEAAAEIPATGHTEVVSTPAIEATCTAPGATAVTSCEVCGELLQEAQEIPVKGHTYDDFMICVDCGYEYVTEGLKYAISANGNYVEVVGVDLKNISSDTTILAIPSVYNGKPVRAIQELALMSLEEQANGGIKVEKIILRGGSTSVDALQVGYGAFMGNESLLTVAITGSVKFMTRTTAGQGNSQAFAGAQKLSTIILDDGSYVKYDVENVGDTLGAFYDCGTGRNVDKVTIKLVGSVAPIIDKNLFKGMSTNMEILVPVTMDITSAMRTNWANYINKFVV